MTRAWLNVTVTISSPFLSHVPEVTHRTIVDKDGVSGDYVTGEGARFNLASSAGGAQLLAKSKISTQSSDNFYSQASKRSTVSSSLLPTAAICMLSAQSLTIDKYDVTATGGSVITLKATEVTSWGITPAQNGATSAATSLTQVEGLLGASLAPDPTRMTAYSFNSSALLQAETAIPPGQTMTLSAEQVSMIVNRVWSKRSQAYLSQFKVKRGDAKVWQVIQTAPNGWNSIEGFTSEVTLPAAISEAVRIPVEIATDGTVTISDSDDEAAYAAQDAYTFEMQKAVAAWRLGVLRAEDLPSSTRPAATVSDALSDSVRAEMDKWWAQMAEARGQMLSKMHEMPTDVRDQIKSQNPAVTDDSIRDLALNGANATQSSSWWTNVKDSVSASTAWLGDLLKSWGPTGIVGAWAGVTAVNSAKKSSIPAWLIIGGLGIVAYKLIS